MQNFSLSHQRDPTSFSESQINQESPTQADGSSLPAETFDSQDQRQDYQASSSVPGRHGNSATDSVDEQANPQPAPARYDQPRVTTGKSELDGIALHEIEPSVVELQEDDPDRIRHGFLSRIVFRSEPCAPEWELNMLNPNDSRLTYKVEVQGTNRSTVDGGLSKKKIKRTGHHVQLDSLYTRRSAAMKLDLWWQYLSKHDNSKRRHLKSTPHHVTLVMGPLIGPLAEAGYWEGNINSLRNMIRSCLLKSSLLIEVDIIAKNMYTRGFKAYLEAVRNLWIQYPSRVSVQVGDASIEDTPVSSFFPTLDYDGKFEDLVGRGIEALQNKQAWKESEEQVQESKREDIRGLYNFCIKFIKEIRRSHEDGTVPQPPEPVVKAPRRRRFPPKSKPKGNPKGKSKGKGGKKATAQEEAQETEEDVLYDPFASKEERGQSQTVTEQPGPGSRTNLTSLAAPSGSSGVYSRDARAGFDVNDRPGYNTPQNHHRIYNRNPPIGQEVVNYAGYPNRNPALGYVTNGPGGYGSPAAPQIQTYRGGSFNGYMNVAPQQYVSDGIAGVGGIHAAQGYHIPNNAPGLDGHMTAQPSHAYGALVAHAGARPSYYHPFQNSGHAQPEPYHSPTTTPLDQNAPGDELRRYQATIPRESRQGVPTYPRRHQHLESTPHPSARTVPAYPRRHRYLESQYVQSGSSTLAPAIKDEEHEHSAGGPSQTMASAEGSIPLGSPQTYSNDRGQKREHEESEETDEEDQGYKIIKREHR